MIFFFSPYIPPLELASQTSSGSVSLSSSIFVIPSTNKPTKRLDKNFRLADTAGNHQTDVIGFGDDKLISFNNGDNTFQDPTKAIWDFAYNVGG